MRQSEQRRSSGPPDPPGTEMGRVHRPFQCGVAKPEPRMRPFVGEGSCRYCCDLLFVPSPRLEWGPRGDECVWFGERGRTPGRLSKQVLPHLSYERPLKARSPIPREAALRPLGDPQSLGFGL